MREVGSEQEKGKKFWLKKLFENIQNVEEQEWRAEIDKKPKLRLYKTFKSRLELEPYLLINREGRVRSRFTA